MGNSAETYRALQERTADLQQSLGYQTATSDVLKVISRSTFDLQPVLDTVAETAARLCNAEQAAIFRREGELWRLAANFGFPPEFEADWRELGAIPFDGHSPAAGWRTVRERRPVHIHDAAAVPGYLDTVGARQGKQRTTLGVPLLREGDVIGNIVLARQHVEPFTERQIELASTFADQAVIAIENTRLITEQREALERQTATAEVLQVINTNPGNVVPVFNAILERAHTLCAADGGALYTYDGTNVRTLAVDGYRPEYAAEMLARLPRSPDTALLQRMIETGGFVQIADAQERPAQGAPIHRENASERDIAVSGMRTVVAIPLFKDDALIGHITAWRREVRLFSANEIALLENFAPQAVIAMENARLLTEQREALEQQTATAEVLQVINASPGRLEPVFNAVIDNATRLCQAELGDLAIYDGNVFRLFSGSGLGEAGQVIPPDPGTALSRMLGGASVIHIPDIADTDEYRARIAARVLLVEKFGARATLWVALRKEDTLLGVLAIYRREVRPFTDKQIELLQNFAAQAVIAMENARLLDELRQRTDALEEALEYQTATSDVLQVISRSDGEIGSVLDTMVETATRICVSDSGFILQLQDDGKYHIAASVGCSPEFLKHHAQSPTVPGRGTVTGGRASCRADRGCCD
jgi:GAF domain-containing protein